MEVTEDLRWLYRSESSFRSISCISLRESERVVGSGKECMRVAGASCVGRARDQNRNRLDGERNRSWPNGGQLQAGRGMVGARCLYQAWAHRLPPISCRAGGPWKLPSLERSLEDRRSVADHSRFGRPQASTGSPRTQPRSRRGDGRALSLPRLSSRCNGRPSSSTSAGRALVCSGQGRQTAADSVDGGWTTTSSSSSPTPSCP